jgi:hypothetical protein
LLVHIFDGRIVDDVIIVLALKQFEKIDPAFAFDTFKPGEKIVSYMSAVTVGLIMSGTGIIHVDVA